ncbi:GNAT family N-acetyltransferase [Chitinophaga varians]|uniref:GNAT family N-acetyltransferase n=1 Tax=Chitinophaga varians TaxID=2202339 RepID=A0A847S504_9BACT|nr:GNAT family N-acetyltransferase [Chitinophaga varians]NLR68158.1 GNAT family N-acetyltransferase [Chitinophaga varians]
MKTTNDLTTTVLMQLHADVLFTYDSRGRMQQANEPWPDRGPAPLFFMGIPVTGTPICKYRHDVPDELAQALTAQALLAVSAGMPASPPPDTAQYRHLLQADKWEAGPSFLVPENFTAAISGIQLTPEHAPLLGTGFAWLGPELDYVQPCAAVVEDGQVAAVCRSVRITAAAHEAGIETLVPFRGKGYAAAALACWAALVRKAGALPLYSTSWSNHASRSVARKAGLLCYGSTLSVG